MKKYILLDNKFETIATMYFNRQRDKDLFDQFDAINLLFATINSSNLPKQEELCIFNEFITEGKKYKITIQEIQEE